MKMPIVILLLFIAYPGIGRLNLTNAHYQNSECKSFFRAMDNLFVVECVIPDNIVHTKIFTVKQADPIAIVGNFTDSVLSTTQLLLNPYLNVSNGRGGIKSNYLITSFKLEVTSNSGDIFELENKGREFSQLIKTTIKALGKGSTLLFHYIKAVGPDNVSGKLPQFTILIQ